MPFIILGRERFALPIGDTRIGGTGDDALPFPELARQTTIAVLTLTPDGTASLSRQGTASATLAVDGKPVGTDPVRLTHGAKIEAVGVRLSFGDLRARGATAHVTGVTDEELALLRTDAPGEPTADSGGRLVALATGSTIAIPAEGVVIGRDPDCDLVLAGREISRRHATIRSSIQGYLLTDTSTTGTYVNRRRVNGAQVLGMGDVIRIGDEELRFEADPATFEPAPGLRPRHTAPLPVPTPSVPLAATPKLLATLEIINEGLLKGTRFRLERPVANVGRNPNNDVKLDDDTVSGSHATLARRTSGWVLLDHGSTNGTYVDGDRITGERQLAGAAELRFGGVKMLFRPIAHGSDADTKKTRAVVGVSLEQSRKSKS
ncbi:MAG: FHA domain-containing protein [Gemmatimonadota bacterium]|nr:FHA domain-containing protein [Gemmatimonadota bacterium]